jgi:hypothetical protein
MTDEFTTPGEKPQRQPGEFRRRGVNGPPYITSLTETKARGGTAAERIAAAEAAGIDLAAAAAAAGRGTKVSGKFAAELLGPEPASEVYARPSSLGEEIGNSFNLIKWKERQVALGIALEPDVLERLQGIDAAAEKDTLDGIVAHAHKMAGSAIAANRGTFVHLLTEWADAGMNGTPPYCDPAFNLTNTMIDAVAVGWRQLINDNNLELLSSEATIVNDAARAAGSLDRHVMCNGPLQFGLDDNAPTIAAGTAIVLDIKTSTLHPDSNGLPSYWAGYPIQLYTYAAGVRYDPDNDQGENRGRLPWGYTVSSDHAVIAHLDIPALLAGDGAIWSLIYVDLTVGKVGLDAVLAAKAYGSIAKTAFAMSPYTTTVTTVAKVMPSVIDRRKTLETKYLTLTDTDRAAFVALGIDMTDLDAVAAGLAAVDPIDQSAPPTPITKPEPVAKPPTLAATADEGVINAEGRKLLEPLYAKLDGVQMAWLSDIAADAQRAGAGLGLKEHATERRLAIVTGIVTFAAEFIQTDGRDEADQMFRAVLAAVVGNDIAWSAAFSPGQIIASLDVEAARNMRDVVALLTTAAIEVGFTDDGRPTLTTNLAAIAA